MGAPSRRERIWQPCECRPARTDPVPVSPKVWIAITKAFSQRKSTGQVARSKISPRNRSRIRSRNPNAPLMRAAIPRISATRCTRLRWSKCPRISRSVNTWITTSRFSIKAARGRCALLAKSSVGQTIKPECADVIKVVQTVYVLKQGYKGGALKNSNGVAIYFPTKDMSPLYPPRIQQEDWLGLVLEVVSTDDSESVISRNSKLQGGDSFFVPSGAGNHRCLQHVSRGCKAGASFYLGLPY